MKLTVFIPLMLSMMLCASCSAENNHNTYSGTVGSVQDGDSVRVRDMHGKERRIRLAYIDAPENDQAYGQASRNALKDLLERRKVEVEVFSTDQYGRQVARIFLDGKDINLSQIENGNAWHYRSVAREQQAKDDYRRYEAAQEYAKQNRNGLWQDKKPTPPWQFRYRNRHRDEVRHSDEGE